MRVILSSIAIAISHHTTVVSSFIGSKLLQHTLEAHEQDLTVLTYCVNKNTKLCGHPHVCSHILPQSLFLWKLGLVHYIYTSWMLTSFQVVRILPITCYFTPVLSALKTMNDENTAHMHYLTCSWWSGKYGFISLLMYQGSTHYCLSKQSLHYYMYTLARLGRGRGGRTVGRYMKRSYLIGQNLQTRYKCKVTMGMDNICRCGTHIKMHWYAA